MKATVISELCTLGVLDAVQDASKAVSAGLGPLPVSSVAGPSVPADARTNNKTTKQTAQSYLKYKVERAHNEL